MLRRIVSQPLPMDIRNWSFRGRNCEGWDFEGRNIRGCDFRNAKLADANFSKVIAGRSRRQLVVGTLLAFAGAFAFIGAGGLAFAIVVILAFVFAALAGFRVSAGFVLVFGGMVAGANAVPFAVSKAIPAFSKGQTTEGIVRSAVAIFFLLFALYSTRESVREFRKVAGTNFEGADLKGATFSTANVSNTNFRHAMLTGACIQNWTLNSGTQFEGLICEHIFLTPDRDPQNRRPLSGSFAPGDFAKLVD
jgi:Pentapeptide repeats (8 copies)